MIKLGGAIGECLEFSKEEDKWNNMQLRGSTSTEVGGQPKPWMTNLLVASQNLKFHFGTDWQRRKREKRIEKKEVPQVREGRQTRKEGFFLISFLTFCYFL